MPIVTVDLEKCTGAGVCKSVCPVDIYELVEMPKYDNEIKAVPERMEDCIMCMACVNGCPEQAITVESE
ncbi:4Fe-4S dicluster domain-containing protein [Candidatus Bathyarchaeota archaeon]|nr:MAG: 4Fe-4S dicluster domain-containing protein [Candidatus Bathyarchaeota archaeon]